MSDKSGWNFPVEPQADAEKRIAELEGKLAECEREKAALQANFDRVVEERNSSDDYISHLERKLAAAREAIAPFVVTAQRLNGENWERSVVRDLSIGEWRNLAKVYAALTEAGEEENKE